METKTLRIIIRAQEEFYSLLLPMSQSERFYFYDWLLGYLRECKKVSEDIIKDSNKGKLEPGRSKNMDDIELRNIEHHQPLIRNLYRSESFLQEEKIDTEYGTVVVAVQGEKNKPAILTYHDIGLNNASNFQAFFNFVDTAILMQSFSVYHINAVGQEEHASSLPENFVYPTMDQLAGTIIPVMKFFGLKHFIGFGVGAGANILSRFALENPDCVDGLFLINPTCTVSSWSEWGYQKLNTMHLRSSGMTASTQDYLMWHHFGRMSEDRSQDLINLYRNYFYSSTNPRNLALFIDSFVRRNDLGIVREIDISKKDLVKNFKCHVLLMAGDLSPHLEDSVTMNSRLDPTNSTWMKLNGCGMVLEEEPAKVSEALRYFLQGLGHALNQCRRRASSIASSHASSEAILPGESKLRQSKESTEESNAKPDSFKTVIRSPAKDITEDTKQTYYKHCSTKSTKTTTKKTTSTIKKWPSFREPPNFKKIPSPKKSPTKELEQAKK